MRWLSVRPSRKLHDHKSAPIVFADVVNGANIGMVQDRRGPSFAAKALQRRGIVSYAIGQKFDGDKPAEASVLCLIDHAHATRTQRALDFVGTKFRARGEVHPWAQL